MRKPEILKRLDLTLKPDPSRVIVRPFKPTVEPRDLMPTDKVRANHIVDRIMGLSPEDAATQLADVLENFQGRHRNLLTSFEARADEMEAAFVSHTAFSQTQRHLVGAYFLNEYAFESAALFNPSIVRHPDQTGAPEGGLRFIMSLRAVGEGHVSSLTFRSGTIAGDGRVILDSTAQMASLPKIENRMPVDVGNEVCVSFCEKTDISERVIFPVTLSQSNGIEDARFLAFVDEGITHYIATYTAYNGRMIRSELIQTDDFLSFKLSPLTGDATLNKGMAMFPRRISGRLAMVARQDNENLYLTYSDDLYNWQGGVEIMGPKYPWEFVQIGNCGAPIELAEGWLLLTHGVGPMRRYCIGAALLDKTDPSRILARSEVPLVSAIASERIGYVPNVAYTCGALVHNGLLILPFAVSDSFVNFATIRISDLLANLVAAS